MQSTFEKPKNTQYTSEKSASAPTTATSFANENVLQTSVFDVAEENPTKNFAVLDTETNWNGEVMSIGIVVAQNTQGFPLAEGMYFVLTPEIYIGGMYDYAISYVNKEHTSICSREAAVAGILQRFSELNVHRIFAYNARFDFRCLPELASFDWFDIMRLAAYRQFNTKIPSNAECLSTGRLKRGYGVEPILQMLYDSAYRETHNALFDAADELKLMRLLGHGLGKYIKMK